MERRFHKTLRQAIGDRQPACSPRSGHTLIELMIAMAIAGLVLVGVYTAFGAQLKTHTGQQLTVEIQQHIRSALTLMQRDIRMAGYDATWRDDNGDGLHDTRNADLIDNDCDGRIDAADTAGDEAGDQAGFIAAGAHYLQFRLDRGGDGDFCDSEDRIGFGFATARDRNRDGIADAGAAPLGRSTGGGGLQPLAENFQAIAFGYAFDDDRGAAIPDGGIDMNGRNVVWAYDSDADGFLDTLLDSNADGVIDSADDLDGNGRIDDVALTPAVPIKRIRAVHIWLLARTRSPLRGHLDRNTYVVGDKVLFFGDHYKRELLTAIVYCRNLGLRL
ncbi:MAG: prepilin-type N-terminal cleavage/methylation domain-containing protein [Deltaproteobacteria bacterium]|nr:prepilin-type N-terminal cleavage/methylation domain-containing protein [Deltaproteobacteria bacterium]